MANGAVKSSSRTSIANFSWSDQVTLVWFLLDAFTHLSIEALYLYFATMVPGGAKASSSPLAFIWKEYGKADERLAMRQTNRLAYWLEAAVGTHRVLHCQCITLIARAPHPLQVDGAHGSLRHLR